MKRILLLLLSFALFPFQTGFAQQTNTALSYYKAAYGKTRTSIALAHEEQKADAQKQYGKTLDILMDALKKKGDLDSFLLVQAESKRFGEKKNALEPADAPGILAAPITDYLNKIKAIALDEDVQTAKLLKQYGEALDELIKKAMMSGNIDEAKTIKEEKDRALLVLNDLESRLPQAAPPPVAEPGQPPENKPVGMTSDEKAAAKKAAREKASQFQSHSYLLVETPVTWKEAEAACENMGGHLVTIWNKNENTFVRTMAAGKNVWLGLTDEVKEGKFVWTDGLVPRSSNWAPGEPDNTNGTEHYVALREHYGNYGWCDEDGQKTFAYICEWDY